MNNHKRSLVTGSAFRWLMTAGATAALLIPLSASADHQDNGLVEIVASAAVAYVVVDAVGGFDDDKDRRKRSRYHDGHRHHHDGYRHREHDRRYWARHDQRRHDDYHGHRKHWKHHGHGHGKGHRGCDHRDHRYRFRAYH